MPGTREWAISKLRQWAGLPNAAAGYDEQCAHLRRQMGINDAAPLTAIKQYGEYRTGTNALRALLLENFDNALVLMYLLGDKHHDAVDFAALASALSAEHSDPARIILNTTWGRPGGMTRRENFAQIAFTHAFALQIQTSVTSRSLRAVLSIRHPLTWMEAVTRFWLWPPQSTGDPWLEAEELEFAKGLCQRFNARYSNWSQAVDALGERARIVHFETLEERWPSVVNDLATAFPLHRRHNQPVRSRRTVEPSPWDNAPPRYSNAKHQKRALRRPRLRKELEAIVKNEIDWTLMKRFGYSPEPSEPLRTVPQAAQAAVAPV